MELVSSWGLSYRYASVAHPDGGDARAVRHAMLGL